METSILIFVKILSKSSIELIFKSNSDILWYDIWIGFLLKAAFWCNRKVEVQSQNQIMQRHYHSTKIFSKFFEKRLKFLKNGF